MWILPSTISPSAPAAPASTSDSNSSLEMFAPSVGVNGKRLPLTSFARAWKRDAYLRRLCGRTSRASTDDPGVAAWIQSLLATRASRSVAPATVVDRMILDICGPKSAASLAKWNRDSCFSRMSVGISPLALMKSLMTWKTWVTKLRRASLLRRKSAPAISESDCSSLAWPTIRAQEDNCSMEATDARKLRAREKYDAGEYAKGCGPPGMRSLNYESQRFNRQWQTPNTQKGGGKHRGQERSGELLLVGQAEETGQALSQWPTAAARDYRTPNTSESQARRKGQETRGQQLNNFVIHNTSLSSRLDPPTSTSGAKSSRKLRGSALRLNPVFVSWLMGWPPIAPAGCDSWATEWSRFRQRMRSRLCGLLCGWENINEDRLHQRPARASARDTGV